MVISVKMPSVSEAQKRSKTVLLFCKLNLVGQKYWKGSFNKASTSLVQWVQKSQHPPVNIAGFEK